MEKLIQKLRRAIRGSMYRRRPLIEEFNRDMNSTIKQNIYGDRINSLKY